MGPISISIAGAVRSSWLRTLAGGAAIYAFVTTAAVTTQNIHLVPLVLLLGALLVPVAFVIFLFERLREPAEVLPAVTISIVGGGSLGLAAASILEYQTLRGLGTLPMLAVGLIEESVKLAVPLWLFARGRFRSGADGLVIGVAAGMGFAALETMGYGLVALVQSGGRIGAAEQVLLIRGLLSPVGHAAWTGLVCAELWRTRGAVHRARASLAVAAAFGLAVVLHALWDSTDSNLARTAIGLVSGALLLTRIHRARGVGHVGYSQQFARG